VHFGNICHRQTQEVILDICKHIGIQLSEAIGSAEAEKPIQLGILIPQPGREHGPPLFWVRQTIRFRIKPPPAQSGFQKRSFGLC